MIPKIIHYIWFGGNKKSDLIEKCINSWRLHFPDYMIMEWNEDNYDVGKNSYISEAYRCKKWAFVSDYVRFDVLYNYGGIYFDTDVEILRNFDPEILRLNGFTGMESTNEIAPGLVFGCIPKHPFLKLILDQYEGEHFIVNGKENPVTVNNRVTELMVKKGYKKNGQKQSVNDICIFPAEYFCGFDLDVFEPRITKNTFSIHHYVSSWSYVPFKVKRVFQRMLKRTIGVDNYRKVLNAVRFIRTDILAGGGTCTSYILQENLLMFQSFTRLNGGV